MSTFKVNPRLQDPAGRLPAWQNTGVTLSAGQGVSVAATGSVSRYMTHLMLGPEGDPAAGPAPTSFRAPGLVKWGLVARIGEGTPFQVGKACTHWSETGGAIQLAYNDENTGDNNGEYSGTLEVLSPVYRLFNPGGDHLFTCNRDERNLLCSQGWADEGVAFRLYVENGPDRTPVYRLYTSAGKSHHVTTDDATFRQSLLNVGYNDEGIVGYASTITGRPLYQVIQRDSSGMIFDALVTSATQERDNLVAQGWAQQSLVGKSLE